MRKTCGCALLWLPRRPTGMPRGSRGRRPPEPSIGCGPPIPPHPRPGCARPGCCAWRRHSCTRIGLVRPRPCSPAAPNAVPRTGFPISRRREPASKTRRPENLLEPLRALIKQRLGQEPRNPGLLELRAELAGQWSDTKAQLADYTAAIEALSRQTPEPTADLRRLYGRRGNAHVALRQWQQAKGDYARGVTDATTDLALLSNQALALYQIHGNPQAILQLVERHPKLAGSVGDLFIQEGRTGRARWRSTAGASRQKRPTPYCSRSGPTGMRRSRTGTPP